MTRKFFLLMPLCILALALVLAGCDTDGSSNNGNGDEGPNGGNSGGSFVDDGQSITMTLKNESARTIVRVTIDLDHHNLGDGRLYKKEDLKLKTGDTAVLTFSIGDNTEIWVGVFYDLEIPGTLSSYGAIGYNSIEDISPGDKILLTINSSNKIVITED